MTYNRGDIVVVPYPRAVPRVGGKSRPVLVLSSNKFNDAHDFGIVAPFTTHFPDDPEPGFHIVKDWKKIGLDDPSVVVPMLTTIEWADVTQSVGSLPPFQLKQFERGLREVLGL